MKPRAAWCVASALSCLCFALPAHADKEAIVLTYDVGSGCPDRRQFVERVHTFTSKAEIVGDDGAVHRQFGVHVSRSGNTVHGELTIDDQGSKSTRHVSGTTCDEVISALALATAIAVDPDALGGSPPEASTKPAPNEPSKTPPPKPAPTKPPPALVPPRLPSTPASERPRPPALYVSAGGRVGSAITPFPKLEASGELGCTYFQPFEFYVGFAYGPPQHNTQVELEDWLGWLGVGYRFAELEPFSVSTLAAVEAGEVHVGGGSDVRPPRDLQRPWLAVNVGLALREEGPGPLFFQANVGVRAPILLQRYVETTNKGPSELYQVEPLGYLLGLSVGVHFL